MHASVFEIEIKKIKNEIMSRSNQQYLNIQITKPEPSNLKIGLLYLYLISKSYPVEQVRSICTAAGLIQMGLDIHEWVTNEPIKSQKQVEIRQLQVLAGDYFSSQYYRLLAVQEDITSIQMIAQSVRKMNEQKVIYYQNIESLSKNFDQWIAHRSAIEIGLFDGFIHSADVDWMILIKSFIQLDLLQFAQDNSLEDQSFLQQQNTKTINLAKEQLAKFQESGVFKELQHYLFHFETLATSSLVAEEI